MHRTLLLLTMAGLALQARAQLGGSTVFRVLDIPSSARVSALGGNQIAVFDNDLNLGIFNPGLLNKGMGHQAALSYLPYFDGINIGYASYAQHFDSIGATFSGTIQYVDYGSFLRTEADGTELGTFRAGEYVFQLGGAMPVDSLFTVGANVKFITSNLDVYTSSGVAVDVGGSFVKRSMGLTVGALLRNIGYQTSSFNGEREKLPFQFQLGATYKFRHAPFRLGLMLENLQQWDLTYEDPNQPVQIDPTTGEAIVKKVTNAEKAMLHVIGNAEIILSENLMVRLGYNHRRRKEMTISERPGITGMSFGVGLKVSKLHISYGYSRLHLAGASNTITLAMRFADLRREEVPPAP